MLRFLISCCLTWLLHCQMWMGNAQTAPTAHQRQWSVAPIVGFTPETRWQFGATTTMLYKPNPLDSLSRTSNANALAIFSTSGQLLFHVNHSTFLKAERYFLRGAADYMYFPWLYYGIGDATRAENEEAFNFKRVTFQQIAFLQLTKQFFVGAGYRYAQMFDMQIAPEGLLATEQITGYRGARSSGGILALLWDTRNNILNSRKGILIELQAAQYARNLGSTNAYAIFTADLRKYFTLAPHRGDVLAFQAYAYVGTPQTPFMDLAALGGSNIMRGYYQGRYRDLTQAAAQAEYRFPILAWLGGVAFVAGGNVSPDWQSFDWSRIKTAAGLGLRFKVIPGEDVNLRFDYAFGPGVRNFYFGFAEAF